MALNEYDETLQSLAGEQAVDGGQNAYADTIRLQDQGRTQRLRSSVQQAAETTPDRAAEVSRLSRASGLPAPIVDRNLDALRKRHAVQGVPYEEILRDTPTLGAFLEEPTNAALAQDDLAGLGALEWLMRAPQRALARGIHQVEVSRLRAESLFRPLTREEQDRLNAARFYMEQGGELGATGSAWRQSITGAAAQLPILFGAGLSGLRLGIPSAVTAGTAGALMGPGAPVSVPALFGAGLTAGTLAGAAEFGFRLEAGLAYDEFLAWRDELGQPLDPDVAKAAALAAGAGAAGFEAVGLGALARTIPGVQRIAGVLNRQTVKAALRSPTVRAALGEAVKLYGGTLAAETAVEVAQRAVVLLAGEVAKAASGQNFEQAPVGPMEEGAFSPGALGPSQFASELANEAKHAALSFALLALPGPVMGIGPSMRRAQAARDNEAFFVALGEGVAGSKTLARSPEAVQAFLQEATKDGPIPHLYVPVESWREYWQSQGLDPAAVAREVTGDAEAYELALTTGQDLEIATATYAVKLAGTPHNAALAAELRLGPDEMNAREAQAFLETAETPAVDEDAAREQEIIRSALERELVTAGMPADTAQQYATLYEQAFTSMAQRAGVDPVALFESYGVQVRRPDLQAEPRETVPFTRVDTADETQESEGVYVSESPADRGADRRRFHTGSGVPASRARGRGAVETRQQRGEREREHFDAAFQYFADAARNLDPLVNLEELRAEFDARLEFLSEGERLYRDSGHDPIDLLREVARLGGLGPETWRGYAGELRWLKEGSRFGRIQGISGVFRSRTEFDNRGAPARGLPIDVMLQRLQANPRFSWIQGPDQLVDLIDDAIRHDAQDTAGELPGTERLVTDLLMRPGERWWLDSWRREASDAAADAMPYEGGPLSFDPREFEQGDREDAGGEVQADLLDTGEAQARLPEDAGAVRDQERPSPLFEVPFQLRAQVLKRPPPSQGELFQSAWHGSPHQFEEFSLHAIGTGEGAQAYGWGLYFASRREVAEWYRDNLTARWGRRRQPADTAAEARIREQGGSQERALEAIDRELEVYDRVIESIQALEKLSDRPEDAVAVEAAQTTLMDGLVRLNVSDPGGWSLYEMDSRRMFVRTVRRSIQAWKPEDQRKGRLFRVEIPDDADFLDRGKSLAQQSDRVKDALRALGYTVDGDPKRGLPSLEEMRAGFERVMKDGVPNDVLGHYEEGLYWLQFAESLGDRTQIDEWYRHEGWRLGIHEGAAGSIGDWYDSFFGGGDRMDGEMVYRDIANRIMEVQQSLSPQSLKRDLVFDFVSRLPPKVDPFEAASRLLGSLGVAGIRYLDGASRRRGDGTANYVVFDDRLVKVVEYEQSSRLVASHELTADNLKHAARMGGLAVPSIAVQPEGVGAPGRFGEITLIGTKAMADPATSPVFDADAYSMRMPTPDYGKADRKKLGELLRKLEPIAAEFDDDGLLQTLEEKAVQRPNPESAISTIRYSLAARAMYLREQGVDVSPVMVEAANEAPFVAFPSFQRFLAETGGVERLRRHGYEDREYRQKLAQAIRGGLEEWKADVIANLPAERDSVLRAYLDAFIDDEGLPAFGRTLTLERAIAAVNRQDVDRLATRNQIDALMVGRVEEFDAWARALILEMHGEPMVTVGRKRLPYTLENVVQAMTRKRAVKGTESVMTFGPGMARAAASHRFRTLEKMREAAARSIRSNEEVAAARKRSEKVLEKYRMQMVPFYTGRDWRGNVDTWAALDASMRALVRVGANETSEGMARALLAEGFAGVTDEAVRQALKAARTLMSDPVPYFEAKPQRAVRLEEFAGAVIPVNADQGTREALESAGVRVMEYDPSVPDDRSRVVGEFQQALAALRDDVMFQERRGSIVFGPNRKVTINLFERADLSTFLHEGGHLFLEVFGDLVERVMAVDAAQRTPAQHQMLSDYQTLLTWFGVSDREAIGRDQHEQFARAFEAYLLEGKAPSLELRSAFARFRAWLLGVYRTVRNLGVTLQDDVRQVFDRMVAADEAIAAAEAESEARPMFLTADAAQMSEEEFGLYRHKVELASQSARERLEAQLLDEVRREQQAAWKAQRVEIREAVSREMGNRREYRALVAMQRGTQPDGTPLVEGQDTPALKLSRQIIVDRYGADRLRALPRPYIYTREANGLDPDVVAELFGFSSGDEMLTALTAVEPFRAAVERETDRRMLAEHGSLLLDGSLHERARTAVASEEREAIIRAELRALGQLRRTVAPHVRLERERGRRALQEERAERAYERRWFEAEARLRVAIAEGKKQAEIDALRAEVMNHRQKARGGPATIRAGVPPAGLVRAQAQARIASMRVRDVRPHRFWQAARQAAQRAIEAAARQDFEGAIVAKQQELLNIALYREASVQLEEVERRVKAAQALATPAARRRLGLAGQTYLDQVDGILDRFEFARVSRAALDRRASLRKWVEGVETQGVPVDLPDLLLDEALRANYQELTVDELIGVTDGLRHIEHLARLKSRLLRAAEQRDLDELAGDLAESIRERAKRRRPKDRRRDRGPRDERSRLVEGFIAAHRKMASIVRELDGFMDGGPVWEAIIRPINEAGAREAQMKADATKALGDLINGAFPGREKRRLYERQWVPEVGESLSRMERLMIALNWGNEGNRDRVRRAEGWTDQQVEAVLNTLTAADWRFVQGVWDYIDSFWTQIAEKQQRVTGLAPTKVEAMPVRTPFGEMRGGYFPLKYDDRLSAAAAAHLDLEASNLQRQAAYVQATTRRGHTKERQTRVSLPVRLDFGVIFEHVGQVIHDLAYHEALIDVGRVLGHKAVQSAIYETHGDIAFKQLKNGLRDVAFGDVPATNAFESAINHLRQGATVVGLGWNLVTAMLQPFGLTQGIVRIGPRWVGRGLSRWMRDAVTLENTAVWVRERSTFMRLRGQTMQREINEIRQSLGVNTGRFSGWLDDALRTVTADKLTKQAIADSYFWMIQKMQQVADLPIWLGEYEKAMASGADEATAVARADQAVLDSQGGGQVKDLAQVQRGGPMMRLWTNFYSFFNTTLNLTIESTRRTNFRDPVDVGRLAVDYLLLYTIPASMGYFLREALRADGDDDGETVLEGLIRENLGYMAGVLLGLREVSGALQGFYGYEGPAGARAFATASRLARQIEQGEPDAAFWRALNDVGGMIFHYPAGQVRRTLSGVAALSEGRTENPGALVTGARLE